MLLGSVKLLNDVEFTAVLSSRLPVSVELSVDSLSATEDVFVDSLPPRDEESVSVVPVAVELSASVFPVASEVSIPRDESAVPVSRA